MKKKLSHILAWFVSLGLMIHFLFGLAYCLEGKYTPRRLNEFIGQYMLPVFHQNWRLFAPDPPICQPTLYVRYKLNANKSFSVWKLLGQEDYKAGQIFRTGFAMKRFRLNEAYASDLLLQVEQKKDVFSIERSRSYNLALEYATYSFTKTKDFPSQMQLAVSCSNVTNRTSQKDTVFFPIEDINALH